jgi:undecaprenyl diphosphate synthase
MDGNGRWAKNKGLPLIAGHRAGAEAARSIVKKGSEIGIQYLTFYTFSSENWFREQSWLDDFMGLLRWYLKNEIKQLMGNGVRIRVIGNTSLFASDIQEMISKIEDETKNNTKITVVLALSYGGQDEIIRACQALVEKAQQGQITSKDITTDLFSDHLDTKGIPNPDLLIRTSGEQRISNFLPWQMVYTEFLFSPVFWPDFSPSHLDDAINTYSQRNRRYGLYTS